MKTMALLSLIIGLSANASLAHADGDPITADAPKTVDFVLFSSVKVKPDSIVEFKSTVLPYAEQTRLEEGCLEYRVHQSPDDPTQFETYEHWKSDEARSAHLAALYTVQFFKSVGALFEAGYPVRQRFVELK